MRQIPSRPQLKRDPLGSSVVELRVNTLKALPALKYLLADAGLEPPYIIVAGGWPVYRRFMALPADSTEDVGGFQTHWLRETPDNPVYEVLLCRQLTDDAQGVGPLTRLIALQFLFEGAPGHLPETEIWATEYRSLEKYFDHVESLPQFQFALEGAPTQGDAILYDEDVPDVTGRGHR